MIRRRTLNFAVTMLEESSFSSFASAVKSDDNGVSACEADNGGSGNGITAASRYGQCSHPVDVAQILLDYHIYYVIEFNLGRYFLMRCIVI